jgi:hypothetical protein
MNFKASFGNLFRSELRGIYIAPLSFARGINPAWGRDQLKPLIAGIRSFDTQGT